MWIIELLVMLFLLPYLLFGVLLAVVARVISQVADPVILLFGVWFVGFGIFLLAHSTPDDKSQFIGIVDSIAQGHLFGVSAPMVAFAIAGALLLTAIFVAMKKHYGQQLNR